MDTKKKIVFIGAGGHSKSVLESLGEDFELIGYVDDQKKGKFQGKCIFGKTITGIVGYKKYYYFVTIGDNDARRQWFLIIKKLGLKTVNIIDKSAIISPKTVIGTGNFIGKGVVINADVSIGSNNIINTRSIIEHECTIGDHVHVSTNAVVNGNVVVKNGVFLGSSSVVIGQLTIGEGSVVGAGSVVIRNIDGNAVYVGVPAKKIRTI